MLCCQQSQWEECRSGPSLTISHCSPLPKPLKSTYSTFKEARRKRTSLRGDRKDKENCCTIMMALYSAGVHLSSRMHIFTCVAPLYLTEYGIAQNSVKRHVSHHTVPYRTVLDVIAQL